MIIANLVCYPSKDLLSWLNWAMALRNLTKVISTFLILQLPNILQPTRRLTVERFSPYTRSCLDSSAQIHILKWLLTVMLMYPFVSNTADAKLPVVLRNCNLNISLILKESLINVFYTFTGTKRNSTVDLKPIMTGVIFLHWWNLSFKNRTIEKWFFQAL